jgi:hypothetical protein
MAILTVIANAAAGGAAGASSIAPMQSRVATNFCGFFGACLWYLPNEFQWRSKRRKPKPCEKTYRAVRCAFWIKVKNPNSPAMLRAEEGTW